MRRPKTPRISRLLTIASAALFLSVLAIPGLASARSYTMPAVRIDATVTPDGSLAVREARTFSFSGAYHGVYWELEPPAGGAFVSIGVTGPDGPLPHTMAGDRPPGYFHVTQNGNITRIEAYREMTDEQVTFVLRYTVKGAAVRWADTSELYWKCIASHWEVGTGHVEAVIALPPGIPPGQIKAWAHGPLTGTVHVRDDSSVVLEVSDLPAGTFVEPRILFPAEALSGVAPRPETRLAQVLSEEKGLAEAANQQRLAAQRELANTKRANALFGGLGIGLPLVLLAVAVWVFAKYGREYRPSFEGRYFREEPADLHPALVSYLMNMGTVQDTSLSASLMRLADRGAIRMEPQTVSKPGIFGSHDEPTYLLTLVRDKWDSISRLDQSLLSFLFTEIAGDDTLTIDEMKSEAKARPQTFHDGVADFKSLVAEEADAMGLLEKPSRTARAIAWVMAFFSGGATFFGTCAAENLIVGVVGGICTVALVVLASLMPRRSPEAAELFAKYRGVRNYLKDFSRLDEAPPASIVLWNHFLVLAVVFGIADRVIEQMRVRIPEVLSDPGLATTYWWVASGPGYSAPANSLSSGFASAASIASSQMSSSSGGGGGFSGGGGGGFGGGGGGGAF